MSRSPRKVLHVLTQRPGRTGSGVTLDALVRGAAAAGWEQRAVVGTPVEDCEPAVGDLPADRIEPLRFGRGGDLPFAVPGMSDVMPYPSTRFAALSNDELAAYRARWSAHLRGVLTRFAPDVIHAHHAWLVGALLRDLAPQVPIVLHGHGTELRQLELCPHLRDEVTSGCRRADRFALLHDEHARRYRDAYGLGDAQVAVVGAGYRDELFHARGRPTDPGATIVYAGKLSRAKGLPWLLDAVERLARTRADVRLFVAGGGAGAESDALRERMRSLAPHVVAHGPLEQERLAALLRSAAVFVLPSFSEGLPLVLVEAAAAGCRLVATRLPGIVSGLAGPLGDALELCAPPRMLRVDEPDPRDLPAFVTALAAALERALQRGPVAAPPPGLAQFTWDAVFARVAAVWRELLRAR